MLIVISPAKTLDFEKEIQTSFFTMPDFLPQSEKLISSLKKKKPAELGRLMSISPELAQTNFQRFQQWTVPFTKDNAKQAIAVFKGDVYIGLDIDQFNEADLMYMQDHLRILSGLHGLLRPLDLIQPYRLEMGTKLKYRRKTNLYEFWGDEITKALQLSLDSQDEKILINLASDEYFKSINRNKLKARIITPIFKDFKNGEYKFLSFFGKKARGMMARYILKNQIQSIENIKLFEDDGYFFNESLSEKDNIVFTRG